MITKIFNVENFLDKDIIEVYTNNGVKCIHHLGYFYEVGESVTEEPDQIYRRVTFSGLSYPLEAFLRKSKEEMELDIIECRQYIDDLTEADIISAIAYMGLSFVDQIDNNTPDGLYFY